LFAKAGDEDSITPVTATGARNNEPTARAAKNIIDFIFGFLKTSKSSISQLSRKRKLSARNAVPLQSSSADFRG
jgi:hypothetical protein